MGPPEAVKGFSMKPFEGRARVLSGVYFFRLRVRLSGWNPGGRWCKPSAPTTLSLLSSIIYAAFAESDFWTTFGTFGTTKGNSNPNPHRAAHCLRNATSSLTLS